MRKFGDTLYLLQTIDIILVLNLFPLQRVVFGLPLCMYSPNMAVPVGVRWLSLLSWVNHPRPEPYNKHLKIVASSASCQP